ncbi:MAG: PAS domain-containing protein, partial [Bacteroidetes bacterium]|nr:PAS domain-containing protein [Bacteroidota bacterium]
MTDKLETPLNGAEEDTAALRQLEEMEERMRLAFEAAHIGMYDKDFATNKVICSPRFLEILGLSRPVMTLDELREALHPDDRHLRDEAHKRALTSGVISYEARVVWPDGSIHWIQARGKMLFNENNEPRRILGTATDITDRKLLTEQLENEVQQRTRELQLSNEALRKSNGELEQFAYVASHDLQEPLRKIQTFVNRLLESKESTLSPRDQDLFRRIQSASGRMNQLIVDLLSYSTVNTSARLFAVTDLTKLLKNVEEQLKESLDQAGAVIHAASLPSVNIIPFQFEQLLT